MIMMIMMIMMMIIISGVQSSAPRLVGGDLAQWRGGRGAPPLDAEAFRAKYMCY